MSSQLADRLGRLSNELRARYDEAERRIKDLNYGVEATVGTGPRLSYRKYKGTWGLYVQYDRDSLDVWRRCSGAPRSLTLEAMPLLPALIDAVDAEAAKLADALDAGLGESAL